MKIRDFDPDQDLSALAHFLAACGRPAHVTTPEALRRLLARSRRNAVAVDESGAIIGFARCVLNTMRGICEITLFEVAPQVGDAQLRKLLLRAATQGVPEGMTWKFGDRALQATATRAQ